MATVNLGNIKFNWKGTYNAGTAYAIDDVVSYNGSSYVCIAATTGNLPTVTAKWDVMSSAGTNGTNGTDVGTTVTTQGDLLYRDGSGLQRLAAGTSGQVLQTGGSGANPSWGTLSSDFVKLGGVDVTSSSATEYSFTQFMNDSVYSNYMIKGYFRFTNSGDSIRARFLNNTSQFSGGSDYYFAGFQAYRTQSHNSGSQLGGNVDANGKDYIQMYGWGGNSTYNQYFELNIFGKPTTSSNRTGFTSSGWGVDNSGDKYIFYDSQGGWCEQTGNIDGIKFYSSNGSGMGNFQATVWGLKK